MATTTFINHRGGETISPQDLALIEAPPPTATWHPVRHSDVLSAVEQTVTRAGYHIRQQQLSVSHEGHRFFGVMDLDNSILDGITLAVGIRNSTDKTFPIGMCCGNRVFCCDNLSFTSEIVIAKRHTKFGQERYREGISVAITSLGQYQLGQAQWINRLRSWYPSRQEADSLILRSYEEGVIGARTLPLLLEEWRKPSFDEFSDGSGWSLWNCYTTIFGRTMQVQPAKAAHTTIRLQGILQPPEVIDVEFQNAAEQQTAV